MHRNHLKRLLNNYGKKHPEEAECVGRFIRFVNAYPNCFERSLSLGHVTGSAWVVSKDQKHVLLTHHRKLDRWLQLGGHADGNTDILSVALREAYEESGFVKIVPITDAAFDVDIHLIPQRSKESAHHHYDVRFVFQVIGSEKFEVSDESHALAWVPITSMNDFTDDGSLLRMREKWIGLQNSVDE
ncbi:MAG: NUDIX hydrolase [Nitrospiria bacterium]